MGIDIYMKWPKQTEAERKAQFTGSSTEAGNVGYLREAYHGGPYATRYLVKEAFDADEAEAPILASVLRDRLPATVAIALYRNFAVYEQGNDPSIIELEGDGLAILTKRLTKIFAVDVKADPEGDEIASRLNDEQRRALSSLIENRNLPSYALAFVDFVRLAERKEQASGEPVSVIASY